MGAERGIDFGALGLGNRAAMQAGISFLIGLGRFSPEAATAHVAHMTARRGREFAQTATMSELLFAGVDPQVMEKAFQFNANHVGKDTGGMLRLAFPKDFPREGNLFTFVDAAIARVEAADSALREEKLAQMQDVFDRFTDYYHNTRLVALRTGERFVREDAGMDVLREVGKVLRGNKRQELAAQAAQDGEFMNWQQQEGLQHHGAGLTQIEQYVLYGILRDNNIPVSMHVAIVDAADDAKEIFEVPDAWDVGHDNRNAQFGRVFGRLKRAAADIYPRQVHSFVEAFGQALDTFYDRDHKPLSSRVQGQLAEEFQSAISSGFFNLSTEFDALMRPPAEKALQRMLTYLGTPVADREAALEHKLFGGGNTMTFGKVYNPEAHMGIGQLTTYRLPDGPWMPLGSGQEYNGTTCPFFDPPRPRRPQSS